MENRVEARRREIELENKMRAALEDARQSGRCAWRAFADRAHRSRDGFIAGPCGDAIVVAHGCDRQLGRVLRKVADAHWESAGCYVVSDLYEAMPEPGLSGFEVYMKAAADVLNDHFAGKARFFMRSFID